MFLRSLLAISAWIGLAAFVTVSPATAQDPQSTAAPPLVEAVRVVPASVGDRAAAPEASVATARDQKSPANQEPTKKDWGFEWADHPSLYFGKNTRIDFRARVQADVRDSEASIGDTSGFDVARKRVGVEGRVAGIMDFQIERER